MPRSRLSASDRTWGKVHIPDAGREYDLPSQTNVAGATAEQRVTGFCISLTMSRGVCDTLWSKKSFISRISLMPPISQDVLCLGVPMNGPKKQGRAMLTLVMIVCFGGAMAVASSPALGQSVIYACYQKNNGQLRVVPAGEQCRPSEVPISWNIQGPAGSINGLERVDFSTHDDTTSPKHAFANCPAGKVVVGGGAQVFVKGQVAGPIALKKSYPSQALNGWAASAEVMVSTSPALSWFLTAYALCATASP